MLQMPKAGPYIVVGINRDKYSIQDLLIHKITDTHVSNLCEFKYDSSSNMNPVEVAARNAGEFFIDRISEHRCVLQAFIHACSTPRNPDIQNTYSRYLGI